ncbi:MAG: hypothetical protein WBX00_36810 [Isosphaeraceae bacterium]
MNRPDLTIVTFERLIDRGVPVPMIGDGMSRFHVSCTSPRSSSELRYSPRILSHEGPAGLIASHRANRG